MLSKKSLKAVLLGSLHLLAEANNGQYFKISLLKGGGDSPIVAFPNWFALSSYWLVFAWCFYFCFLFFFSILQYADVCILSIKGFDLENFEKWDFLSPLSHPFLAEIFVSTLCSSVMGKYIPIVNYQFSVPPQPCTSFITSSKLLNSWVIN